MLLADFPKITELPTVLVADGWRWEKKKIGLGLNERSFWFGTDGNGKCWIVKMHGKFDAVRERVYASFSQHLGICTQSSTYLWLPVDALPMADPTPGFHPRQQLAIWPLDEHGHKPCSDACPWAKLPNSNDPDGYFDAWLNCGVKNPRDWFDATMLGYLCHKFEPTGSLLTETHWWVQIDNDKMFTGPYGTRGGASDSALEYMRSDPMMRITRSGKMLRDLCLRVAETTDQDFERFLELPPGYRAKTDANHCGKSLRRARTTAKHILKFGLG